jgi:hypothetical protein
MRTRKEIDFEYNQFVGLFGDRQARLIKLQKESQELFDRLSELLSERASDDPNAPATVHNLETPPKAEPLPPTA